MPWGELLHAGFEGLLSYSITEYASEETGKMTGKQGDPSALRYFKEFAQTDISMAGREEKERGIFSVSLTCP